MAVIQSTPFFPERKPDLTPGRKPDVTPERKPDVTVSKLLRAGTGTSITCIAYRSPSLDYPKITWTGISRGESFQHVRNNRVQGYLEFTPTAADHLQNVTCKATYFRVPENVTVDRTVMLNVNCKWFLGLQFPPYRVFIYTRCSQPFKTK